MHTFIDSVSIFHKRTPKDFVESERGLLILTSFSPQEEPRQFKGNCTYFKHKIDSIHLGNPTNDTNLFNALECIWEQGKHILASSHNVLQCNRNKLSSITNVTNRRSKTWSSKFREGNGKNKFFKMIIPCHGQRE